MRGDAANRTRFDCQNKIVSTAFFARDEANAIGNAYANVADRTFAHFKQGASGHQFTLIERQGSLLAVIENKIARDKAVNRRATIQLRLVGVDDHNIDQIAGNTYRLRMQSGFLHHFLHLHHNDATVIVYGLGNHQRIKIHHFIFKGGVAFTVASGGANKGDVWRNGFVIQVLFVINFHQFDQIFGGHFIQLTALLARVNKCTDADITEDPRLVGCRCTQGLG